MQTKSLGPKRLEAEIARINKLMNVNKADQKNKFSKIRSLPKQKVLKEAMKHLEEQKEEKE